MSEEPPCFTFLHLTDIHCAYENLDAVNSLLKKGDRKIDFILSSGDLTNMKPSDNENPDMVKENEAEVTKVLEALLKIHPKVFFIPGNHDACSFFDGTAPKVAGAVNLHNRHFRLAKDLVITSFGGSVPAFQGEKQRWIGYPFDKAEDIEEGLRGLLNAELAEDNSTDAPCKNDSVLLMTHVGPGSSQTAIQQIDLDQDVIKAGCFVLDKIMREPELQERVFLNIHGHTHFAEGVSKLGNTFIFNPGAIAFDCFGIVSIERKAGKWNYRSMEMMRI